MASHDASEKPVGSVFYRNGKLVLQPLPGFERLFPPGSEAPFQARPPSPSLSPSPTQAEIKAEETTVLVRDGGCMWTTVKKRSNSEGQAAEQSPKKQRQEKKMPVHQFRIGDVEGMKKFYYTRLGEVGINALRRIITEWVKVLEPTRLRSYGPYHKLKQYSWDFKFLATSGDKSLDRGPPWWPNDAKEYHIGESLISKLHNAAKYFISTLPAQEYAMGHDAWNAVMKERALQTILPELLQVARDYEEHLNQQGRTEGEREPSPALGKLFTYTELQKPVRKSWKKGKEDKEEKDKEKDKKKPESAKSVAPQKKGVKKVMAVDNLLNA